jgi:CheY-like chemotaxis protein
MSRILIIDDEPAIGWSLREMLSDEGHSVELAASVEAGLETCARFKPEAMLLDVRLPGRDGLSALPELRRIVPHAPVVVMTAFGDLDTAVRAVNAGAFDYLLKPFDLERVSRIMAHALAEPMGAAAHPATVADGGLLVGSSPPMQEVFKQISLVAPTDLPVLITGETGTGKDLAARAIHAHGPRHHRPFVATSLGALAPSVIESELFGHVRGAFTGATSDRPGLFAMADGGTLFLDEIGEAPLDLQVKLLRALENGEVTPVGAATLRARFARISTIGSTCSRFRCRRWQLAATISTRWRHTFSPDMRPDGQRRISPRSFSPPSASGRGRAMSANSSTRSNTRRWWPAAARCGRSTCLRRWPPPRTNRPVTRQPMRRSSPPSKLGSMPPCPPATCPPATGPPARSTSP